MIEFLTLDSGRPKYGPLKARFGLLTDDYSFVRTYTSRRFYFLALAKRRGIFFKHINIQLAASLQVYTSLIKPNSTNKREGVFIYPLRLIASKLSAETNTACF
jgi:hypothetical protein